MLRSFLKRQNLPWVCLFVFLGFALSLSIAQMSPAAEIKVEARQEADRAIIVLTSETDIENYDTLRIEAPPRLITDIWGLAGVIESKTFPSKIEAIKEIRLAPFRERSRLVLDFATAELPPATVSKRNKELIITVQLPARPPERVIAAPPPAAPEPAPPPGVYTGTRVTLDFHQVEIITVFRLLSDVSKLNIVSDQDVKGNITVRMVNMPWDYVLDVILGANNLDKERAGNVIRVAPTKRIKEEKEAKIKAAQAEELIRKENEKRAKEEARQQALAEKKSAFEQEELETRNIRVNYTDATELAKQLEKLKSLRRDASITPSPKTNSILIKDLKAKVEEMLKMAAQIDVPTRQVQIDMRIVRADLSLSRALGIQWGFRGTNRAGTFTLGGGRGQGSVSSDVRESPGFAMAALPGDLVTNIGSNVVVNLPTALGNPAALGMVIGRVSDIFSLEARLTAWEGEGKTKIISSPKVITLDNKEAIIRQGATIPYIIGTASGPVTTFEEADLSLKVTPHITPDNNVLLKVDLTNDRPGASTSAGPLIESRKVTSKVLMADGETIVIGGVLTKTKQDRMEGIPGLMNIPVLGWLFKRKTDVDTDAEVLLFITTRVIPFRVSSSR